MTIWKLNSSNSSISYPTPIFLLLRLPLDKSKFPHRFLCKALPPPIDALTIPNSSAPFAPTLRIRKAPPLSSSSANSAFLADPGHTHFSPPFIFFANLVLLGCFHGERSFLSSSPCPRLKKIDSWCFRFCACLRIPNWFWLLGLGDGGRRLVVFFACRWHAPQL